MSQTPLNVVSVAEAEACRLCGTVDLPLTFEHIPPRSALNDQRVQRAIPGVQDGEGLVVSPGTYSQRGSGEYALCAECNSFLGRMYVRAYADFVGAVAWVMAQNRDVINQLKGTSDPDAQPTLTFGFREGGSPEETMSMFPTRIARQALSMLLIVGPPRFPKQREDLVKLVMDPDETSIPDGVRLGMCFYIADMARIYGIAGIADVRSGRRVILAEVSFPPLSWVLVVNGEDVPTGLQDVTDWLALDYQEEWVEHHVEARLGFGDSLNPADYRTRSQMDTEAVKNLRLLAGPEPDQP